MAISVHLRKMGNEDHLHKAFEFFDKNQSGYIEIEELTDALVDEVETNNEEVINAIMQDVDTDKVRISCISFCLCSLWISGLAWITVEVWILDVKLYHSDLLCYALDFWTAWEGNENVVK